MEPQIRTEIAEIWKILVNSLGLFMKQIDLAQYNRAKIDLKEND